MNDKSKTNKYLIYSLIVVGIIAVFTISMNTIINNDAVISTVEEQIEQVEQQDDYVSGTSVTWHGTLDLFIIEADTGERTQVVYGEPNLITNLGADRLRGYLNSTVSSSEAIGNLSLSNDASAASAAWTVLPTEIAANGLDRATAAAGLVNNGTGKFNITHTWTATDTQSCQLIGTHWSSTDESDGNMFSALKFTQQDLLVNDQLEAIYSVEIS